MIVLRVALMVVVLGGTAIAESPWRDPRLATWAALFHAGRHAELLEAVEKDLAQPDAHPLAAWVWVRTQEDKVGSVHVPDLVPADLPQRERVAMIAEVRRYDGDNNLEASLAKYSIADALRDPFWVAPTLEGAAPKRTELEYLEPAVAAAPWSFLAVDHLASRLSNRPDLGGAVIERLCASPTPACVYLRTVVSHASANDVKLDALEAYIQATDDAWARIVRAQTLRAQERHREAARAFEESYMAFPFFSVGLTSAAQEWVAGHDLTRAKAWIEGHQHYLDPSTQVPLQLDLRLIRACQNAGEAGEARRLLEAATKRHGEGPDLWAAWRDLETHRPRIQLDYARKVVAARPTDKGARHWLLWLLSKASAKDEALRMLKAWEASGEPLTWSAWSYWRDVAPDEEKVEIARRALALWPDKRWFLKDALIATGDKVAALPLVKELIANGPENRSYIDELVDCTAAAEGAAAGEAALDAHIAAYPWAEAGWQKKVDGLGATATAAEKNAVWARAAEANPDELWPYQDMSFPTEAETPAFVAATEKMRAVAKRVGRRLDGDVAQFVAALTLNRALRTPMTAAELAPVIQEYEAVEPTMNQRLWTETLAKLLIAAERNQDAAVVLARFAETHLVTSMLVQLERNRISKESEPAKWFHWYRWVDQDPYDVERLADIADLHARWGGSAIVGLYYYHLITERLGVEGNEFIKRQTLGNLGDHTEEFKGYMGMTNVAGPSLLYTGWYDDARRGAQKDGTAIGLPFDPSTEARCSTKKAAKLVDPTIETWAVVCHPDGVAVVMQHDPITGKPLLVRRGAAWLRARYDDRGQIVRVETSSGAWTQLDYDGGLIVTLSDHEGTRLRFEYGEKLWPTKPSRIIAAGVGVVVVTYDDKGEIENVEGVPAPGVTRSAHAVASEITQGFQNLLATTRLIGSSYDGTLDIDVADPQLDQLEKRFENADGEGGQVAALALATHLAKHLDDRAGNASRALDLLRLLFEAGSSQTASGPAKARAVMAAGLYHEILASVRYTGTSVAELATWSAMARWLEARALAGITSPQAKATLAAMRKTPLTLTPTARWVPRSELNNAGMWTRHVLPTELASPLASAPRAFVLQTPAGDEALADVLVVGTSQGLAARSRGWWAALYFDGAHGRWQTEPTRDNANELTAAAFSAGALWLGSAAGLQRVSDFDQSVTVFDALPEPRVTAVGGLPNGVLVGTAQGARRVTCDEGACAIDPDAAALGPLATAPIVAITETPGPLLVSTPSGLFAVSPEGVVRQVTTDAVESATWSPVDHEIVFLRGRFFGQPTDDEGLPLEDAPTPLPGQEDVVAAKRILGVGLMPVVRDAQATDYVVTGMTDQGLALYRDHHFEAFTLPHSDRHPGVSAITASGACAWLDTSDGLYSFDLGTTRIEDVGAVRDALYHPELDLTVVAADNGLFALMPSGDALERLDRWSATALAPAGPDAFIAGTYGSVVRYRRDRTTSEELFSCDGRITGLQMGRDGTVWATTQRSVWRYVNGEATKFGVDDPTNFPLRSNQLANVLESLDGEIQVVGSDNAFQRVAGVSMVGGLAAWRDGAFVSLELGDEPWFLTSYTRIDDHTAIAGSNAGIVIDRRGKRDLVSRTKEPTYLAIEKEHPALYLATRGTRLGASLWLFGTPSGVIAYRDGEWAWPDRLNMLLPDMGLADYGARAVHGIAADVRGRIVVGTDRGALIVDAGGADPASTLFTSRSERAAFADESARQFLTENATLLSAVTPDSALGERIARVRAAEKKIEELTLALGKDPTLNARPGDAKEERTKIQDELDAATRQRRDYILQIERDDPELYQLIEAKPLEIGALHGELDPGDAVVSYLPGPKGLAIQVATRSGVVLRHVDKLPREDLFGLARAAVQALAPRTQKLRGMWLGAPTEDSHATLDALHTLYKLLLAPVEADLVDARRVWIVPVGALAYVPFGALVTSFDKDGTPKFAIERRSYGYLTSMYMLDLVLHRKDPSGERAVIVGDPDGSLPGARAEAKQVASLNRGALVRIGDEASYEQLTSDAPSAAVLHLATHGVLNVHRPERSYLVLAKGERMAMSDILDLPLTHTRVVVLSACETGLGVNGLEYATLARAFMMAGAPSVIATLWKVPDIASSTLVTAFYKHMRDGEGRLASLVAAQREMLSSDEGRRDPASWAGYVLYGKP